jgi:hypothetical protein
MDDNLAIFLLLLISFGAAVTLILATTWMRGRNRLALTAETGKVAVLESENSELKGEVGLLEERLQVLERIAVDPAPRLAREIESLR